MTSIKTTQQGLRDGWTRATFILKENHLNKIKSLSYWKRRSIKSLIDEALTAYFKNKRIKTFK